MVSASLTKLMTAYIAFSQMKAGKLSPQTEVVMTRRRPTSRPRKCISSRPEADDGQRMKLLLIKSANDIAVAIAETIGGTSDNSWRR